MSHTTSARPRFERPSPDQEWREQPVAFFDQSPRLDAPAVYPMSGAGAWRKDVVRARHVFWHVAVKSMGYSGSAVARFLGVITFAVDRLAVSEELSKVRKYLKTL